MWELLNGGFIRVWQDGVVGNRNRNEMVDEWYIWLVELNTQLKDDASFYAIAYEELKGRDIALVNPGFDEHTGWGWYGLNSSQSKETWKGFPLHSSVKPDSNFYMTHSMLSLLWWFSLPPSSPKYENISNICVVTFAQAMRLQHITDITPTPTSYICVSASLHTNPNVNKFAISSLVTHCFPRNWYRFRPWDWQTLEFEE